jgi:hypothetical protein
MEPTKNTRKALTDCSLCEQTAALASHRGMYAPCPDCMKILMAREGKK